MTDSPQNNRRKVAVDRFLESRRARPAARPAPSAGIAVQKLMRPLAKMKGTSKGSSALALADIWPQIMGPRWSKISSPVRFRGTKEGRILVISAPGAASSLIMAASGQILERLDTHFGKRNVVGLQVVQQALKEPPTPPKVRRGLTPSEETVLQDGLTKVENHRLRTALEGLGRAVIAKNEP